MNALRLVSWAAAVFRAHYFVVVLIGSAMTASFALAQTPPPPVRVMARAGSGGLTSIDSNVSINGQSVIAFTGRDSLGSRVFTTAAPGSFKSISEKTFASSSRAMTGVGINSLSPYEVVEREQVTSPQSYLIRKWSELNYSWTLIGSSINAPVDFNSANSFVDINDNSVVTFPGLINGSTNAALFAGKTRPPTQLAVYSSSTLLRPQISNTDEIVVRDNLGRIVVWTWPSASVSVIAGSSQGFASATGRRPGISSDGKAVAFTGDRGSGAGVFVSVRMQNNTRLLVPAAGDMLGDNMTNFLDEQRVGVIHSMPDENGHPDTRKITVVFVGSQSGVLGVYTRQIILTDGVPPQQLDPVHKVVQAGETVDGFGPIASFTLYDPINSRGALAFTASLSNNSNAVLRVAPPRNLVLITHGWNSNAQTWAADMALAIENQLRSRCSDASASCMVDGVFPWTESDVLLNHGYEQVNWEVATYDWSSGASGITPRLAAKNAREGGQKLGAQLAAYEYTYIHFIAHSAGSWLIDSAADEIRRHSNGNQVQIHETFLDAYNDWPTALEQLGDTSDWSEHYVDVAPLLPPFTNDYLPQAYSVDVTAMRPDCLGHHGWPSGFYRLTITSPDTFPWGYRQAREYSGQTPSHAQYVRGCWEKLYIQEPFSPMLGGCASAFGKGAILLPISGCGVPPNPPAWLNIPVDPAHVITSSTGQVALNDGNSFSMTTGSPVWLILQINPGQPFNLVQFNYEFLSLESQGTLSVSVDGSPVSQVLEIYATGGVRSSGSHWLGFDAAPGAHTVTFQLDPSATTVSSIRISSIQTAYVPIFSPIDYNKDQHVDGTDLAHLAGCISRAQVLAQAGCADADLDGDGDVDMDDFGLFQRCYSGPNGNPDPTCGAFLP